MAKRRRTALIKSPMPGLDAWVAMYRAWQAVSSEIDAFHGDWDLTPAQYNVLRTLYVRDQTGEGMPCSTLGAHMVSRVPDVTRLLDRLEKRGLLERFRSQADRRVVRSRLTNAGLDLIEEMHRPLMRLHREQMSHMSERELSQLTRLLDKVAGGRQQTKRKKTR